MVEQFRYIFIKCFCRHYFISRHTIMFITRGRVLEGNICQIFTSINISPFLLFTNVNVIVIRLYQNS